MEPILAFAMPGTTELVIIAVICVLLFGKRLPKLAFDLGSSFTQFKKGVTMPIDEITECGDALKDQAKEFKDTIQNEVNDAKRTVSNS